MKCQVAFLAALLLASTVAASDAPTYSEWSKEVLAFQRNITRDHSRINQLAMPCTHNSFNTLAQLPEELAWWQNSLVLKDHIWEVNQLANLTEQLDAGIRRLMLEVHYVAELAPNPLILCHPTPDVDEICEVLAIAEPTKTCAELGLPDYGVHTGCFSTSLSFADGLREINNWIVANPTEFVVIQLNNQASAAPGNTVISAITEAFGSKLLTQAKLDAWRAFNQPFLWPLVEETVDDIKTNVVVYIDNEHSFATASSAVLPINTTYSDPFTQIKHFTGCPTSNNRSFEHYYEDETFLVFQFRTINITQDRRVDVGTFTPELITTVTDCSISACVDMLSDKELRSMSWTFQENNFIFSCRNDTLCVYATASGWVNDVCSDTAIRACITTDRTGWALGGHCPVGTTFDYPRTPAESKTLKDLLQSGAGRARINLGATHDPSKQYCFDNSAGSLAAQISLVAMVATVAAWLQW